jgi:APA family basic amino acid/polyamine antiporter
VAVVTLSRRLGLADAIVVGLGSMLGAGVFVVFAPAATRAGGVGLLVAVGVAGFVAACNATSSARLAARYPESGGAYVYGRERLGPLPGFVAGWSFVTGKTASCAAMALAIGAYAWPAHARFVAVVAVVVVTAVNLRGIAKTALATRCLVAVTLILLALVAVVGLTGGSFDLARVDDGGGTGVRGVLAAAGLLFFAFAGYARIATLGEEVREPQRTIPRAVPLALGIVLVVYLLLAVISLAVLGPAALAASAAPLASVVSASGYPALAGVVRAGAVVAVLGVLLALLAGVARTALAMGRRRDLPGFLAAVDDRRSVPWLAEIAVAVLVVALVLVGNLTAVIGASSFLVLLYYGVANASAFTLPRAPVLRAVAVLGVAGCLLLAFTLPIRSVVAGLVVLAFGLLLYAVRWGVTARSRRA